MAFNDVEGKPIKCEREAKLADFTLFDTCAGLDVCSFDMVCYDGFVKSYTYAVKDFLLLKCWMK